jgi:2-polyprenyl-3-methyl-5-hydroxy-6-metoxy-1,4-benzoquinol methylase
MLKQAIRVPSSANSAVADSMQSMLEGAREAAHRLLWPVPEHLRRRQLHPGEQALGAVENSCRRHYYKGWRSEASYTRDAFEKDLGDSVWQRLDSDREKVVPWLDAAMPLDGKRILEIGCGSGSSTVALAEQGAIVTGIDLDEDALHVARDRCRIYGLTAEFRAMNAQRLTGSFAAGEFDMVIFFACLEHMTIEERLGALGDVWKLLPRNGMLAVVETPNRLWYYDDHTSWLNCYHWLPDELAFHYSRFSPRENFRGMYRKYDESSREHFQRRGRGMSFHEFDLAIKPVRDLRVVSSLSSFRGLRHLLRQRRIDRDYKAMLMSMFPGIHGGFFDSDLYLLLEKS